MSDHREVSIALIDKGFSDLNPLTIGMEICRPLHTAYGSRPYHLIHYVEHGEGTVRTGGKTYCVGKGQIFIIPQGTEAVYTADERKPWEYVWIGFVGTLGDRIKSAPVVKDAKIAPYNMIKSLLGEDSMKEELCAAALFMAFADIFSGDRVRPDYVKQTQDAINSLYMTGITVGELAAQVGLDRRYLCRIFHEKLGISVKDYLTKVRMEASRGYLLDGKSVALTAELVGYNDPFNFAKMFKKYFGEPPGSISNRAR